MASGGDSPALCPRPRGFDLLPPWPVLPGTRGTLATVPEGPSAALLVPSPVPCLFLFVNFAVLAKYQL